MATTKHNYTPSINIVRDSEIDFNYIATPNATSIFGLLGADALTGIKAHIIIGAYGIGKSSFLLALQNTISHKKNHFKEFDKLTKQLPAFEFINIVGDYTSFIETVGNEFGIKGKGISAKEVIKAVKHKYESLEKKKKGLAIIVDEFGKFLEYAASNKPEAELYFIQQLAELVNTQDKELILVCTLHQSFNSYSVG
ncbi:MAG TPA: hypothetical protein VIY47_08780, partial [Ignavibacteriaceae bacterium]